MVRPYPALYDAVIHSDAQRYVSFLQRYYPFANELYVTTSYRAGDNGSYHGEQLFYNGERAFAVDLGTYDDPEPNFKDQADMDSLAAWQLEYFHDFYIEVIHTNGSGTGGWYVRNQQIIGGYGEPTNSDHINHIHNAATLSLVIGMEDRARELWPVPKTSPFMQCGSSFS